MRTLFICGSPKKRGSVSAYFLKLLSTSVGGTIRKESLRGKADHARILKLLGDVDAVVFSLPMYVDGIPSHVLAFMEEMERVCRERRTPLWIYVLSNGGFIEGKQNENLMSVFKNFCARANLVWGGGLGIGGGVMLHALSFVFWIYVGLLLLQILLTGLIEGNWFPIEGFRAFGSNMLWMLFLHLGVLWHGLGLAGAIRRRQAFGEKYTRILLPSFLFILIADVFFVLSALIKGILPWQLFKRTGKQG